MKKILFTLCLLLNITMPVMSYGQINVYSPSTVGMKTAVLYGSDYGIDPNSSDNTAAFNVFMAACKAGQYKGELPYGNIHFGSKPNNIDFAWDLSGKGLNGTVLLRDYNESVDSTGLLNIVDANGVKISNMAIESTSGKTGGCMISAISSSTFAISGLVLENLWLSTFGSNTQVYTLYLSGGRKTTAPAGLRDANLKNVHIFGSTNFSCYLKSVIGFSWMGGGIYPAGGTAAQSGGLALTGSGNSANNSSYVSVNIVTCNGLNLTRCSGVNFIVPIMGSISGVSINNDNTCDRANVTAYFTGTQAANWTNSNCTNVGSNYSMNGPMTITNASGGTTNANYLQLTGSIANDANFPGIEFKGGTGATSYGYIQTNNSGRGMTITNGSGASFPQNCKMFFYNGNSAADANSYADFSFNAVSRFRIQSNGLIGVGLTGPTAVLHLKAGTTNANTAPLKFTSGTNLATAETGAMEYNGTNLFFTRTGTTRESVITANSVNTVSPTSPNRTISVVIDGVTYYLAAKTTND